MNVFMRRCRPAVLAVLMTLGACSDSQPTTLTPASEILPPVAVTRLDGAAVASFPARGKITVVNVWATWCPPCRRELPSLERLAKLLDGAHFAVEGVALDDDARLVREYLNDQNVTFAGYLAADADALSTAWGIKNVPATLILDANGRVVERVIGERVWHTQEQVERLMRLAQH